jgi:hypothetical protein
MRGTTKRPIVIVGSRRAGHPSPHPWFFQGISESPDLREHFPVIVATNVTLEADPSRQSINVKAGSASGHAELPALEMHPDLREVPLTLVEGTWSVNGSGIPIASCERAIFMPDGQIIGHVWRQVLPHAGLEA